MLTFFNLLFLFHLMHWSFFKVACSFCLIFSDFQVHQFSLLAIPRARVGFPTTKSPLFWPPCLFSFHPPTGSFSIGPICVLQSIVSTNVLQVLCHFLDLLLQTFFWDCSKVPSFFPVLKFQTCFLPYLFSWTWGSFVPFNYILCLLASSHVHSAYS